MGVCRLGLDASAVWKHHCVLSVHGPRDRRPVFGGFLEMGGLVGGEQGREVREREGLHLLPLFSNVPAHVEVGAVFPGVAYGGMMLPTEEKVKY